MVFLKNNPDRYCSGGNQYYRRRDRRKPRVEDSRRIASDQVRPGHRC